MAEPPAPPWRDLTRKRNGPIPEVLDSLGKNMEKRLPIAIFVNLAPAQNRNGTELTYTENVSAHGACVVSNRPWQPGEIAEVTALLDGACHARKGCAFAGNGAKIGTPSV